MISVRCIRGAGDREADKITDELISTERIAALRGASYLDGVYYHYTERSIRTPWQDVRDGDVIRVSSPTVAVGNYRVVTVRIRIAFPGKIDLMTDLEGKYEDPQ